MTDNNELNPHQDRHGDDPLCNMKSLEEEFKFKTAPDPSDIIWENKSTSSAAIWWGKRGVGLAILIFLIITSGLFYKMKTSFNENLDKYPPSISCDQNIEPLIKFNKSRMPTSDIKKRQ
jgi:hypothetical protein